MAAIWEDWRDSRICQCHQRQRRGTSPENNDQKDEGIVSLDHRRGLSVLRSTGQGDKSPLPLLKDDI